MNFNGKLLSVIFILGSIILPSYLRAEDPKKEALTVLPIPGANVIFSEQDKRFVGSISIITEDDRRMFFQLSAPMDEETRLAALMEDAKLASGFSLETYFGFSRDPATAQYQALVKALEDDPINFKPLVDFCEEKKIEQCNFATVREYCDGNEEESCKKIIAQLDAMKSKLDGPEKDIALHFIPRGGKPALNFGIDLSGAYNRVSAYDGDIADDPKYYSNYSWRIGPQFDIVFPPSTAITIRAGVDGEQAVRVAKLKRCEEIVSGDSTTTGQSCDDEALRLKDDPKDLTQGYVQFAVTWLGRGITAYGGSSWETVVPGIEFRSGVERLGQGVSLNSRLTFFFTPMSDPVAGRFGIGVDYFHALQDANDGSYQAMDERVVPFLFVGVSPSKLK